MAQIRSIPDYSLLPSSKGRFIVDTYRGKFRIRAWPKKRGPATSGPLKEIQRRFREATQVMKYCDAKFHNQAINIAKGNGIYPRDVLGHAILCGMVDMIDEYGQVETCWKPILEQAMYQGCRVQRTSNLSVLAATTTPIPWQQAIIQTVPIFDLALPNRLTVPSNVNIVELKAGFRGNTAVTNTTQFVIRKNGSEFVAELTVDNDSTPAGEIDTGPIPCIAGDWFDCTFFGVSANVIAAVQRTYFAMEIKQTT